jgi:hypothetical protein
MGAVTGTASVVTVRAVGTAWEQAVRQRRKTSKNRLRMGESYRNYRICAKGEVLFIPKRPKQGG